MNLTLARPMTTDPGSPEPEADRDSLLALTDELLILVHETEQFHANERVISAFGDAKRSLNSIRRKIQRANGRHVVAVVGLTNVGKSTLLNALLGMEFAPRRNRPCTSVPIEFSYDPDLKVTVFYEERLDRPCWKFDDPGEVYMCLEGLTEMAEGRSRGALSRIEVTLPLPLLANGLVITDTPGFGAGQAGDLAGTHETAVRAYLKREVSQVFWVVLADQGIGRREVAFHDQFFADVCDDLVVTGCEDWDPDDRARFRRRFAACFGSRMPGFHFVSGLKGLEARRGADDRALEDAGIMELEHRIRELTDLHGRLRSLQMELVQLSDNLAYWLAEYRDDRGRALVTWWRPDSWSRWTAATCSNPLKMSLERQLTQPGLALR